MSLFTKLGNEIASPVDASGNPRSVSNADMQRYFTELERLVMALVAGQGGDIALPNLLIKFSITSGTANAIVATPNLPVPSAAGEALFSIQIAQDNTGPVKINDKALLTNGGEQFAPGEIRVSDILLFLDNGPHYRLLMDTGSLRNKEAAELAQMLAEAAQLAAKAAQLAAEAARNAAADYASDAASQSNVPIYSSAEGLSAIEIPSALTVIRVNGYHEGGGGGGGVLRRVPASPSDRWKIPSADNAWWEQVAEAVNVQKFGAKGDGIADDTAAIQDAIDFGATYNRPVHFPGGVYMSGPLVLREASVVLGDGPVQTTLKTIPGVHGKLVSCEDTSTNDLVLRDMSFDGNWLIGNPNDVDGDTVHLYGARPNVENITIINAAGTALRTENTPSDRTYSILGHFNHITIDRSKSNGWVNLGPNDSYLSHIEVVDVSQGGDAMGYGYFASGDSYSRAFNMHIWNRTTGLVVPRPIAGLRLDNGGNIFTGCHFESGERCVIIGAGAHYNTITDSSFYAPDGGVAFLLGGSFCRITGMVGGNKDYFYPDYIGLVMGIDASNKASGNVIDLMDAGCSMGAVDFSNSGGSNVVRVRGWKEPGDLTYVGTPQLSDDVDIRTDGAAGLVLRQVAS